MARTAGKTRLGRRTRLLAAAAHHPRLDVLVRALRRLDHRVIEGRVFATRLLIVGADALHEVRAGVRLVVATHHSLRLRLAIRAVGNVVARYLHVACLVCRTTNREHQRDAEHAPAHLPLLGFGAQTCAALARGAKFVLCPTAPAQEGGRTSRQRAALSGSLSSQRAETGPQEPDLWPLLAPPSRSTRKVR